MTTQSNWRTLTISYPMPTFPPIRGCQSYDTTHCDMGGAPVTITMRPAKSGIWSTLNFDLGGKLWSSSVKNPAFLDAAPPIVVVLRIRS